MAFDDLLSSDLAIFLNSSEFAKTGVYIDERGNEKNVTILPEFTDEFGSLLGQSQASFCNCVVKTSEVPEPKKYEKFSFVAPGGETQEWKVENVVASDSQIHNLRLIRDIRA